MRIVFAGTPEIAVPTLNALLDSVHDVPLVITQPDRAAGRGRKRIRPPVAELAGSRGVPLLQPESINQPEAARRIREPAPDVLVVFAYGKRLTRRVLKIPRLGACNLHASLLPRYRGAAPIHHAILNGEIETGITVQRMGEDIDTGPILAQRAIRISPEETAGELSDRLATLAAELIVPTLEALDAGAIAEQPQDPALASKAPRLCKANGAIPWNRPAQDVANFVRAMTPWPGAFTFTWTSGAEARPRIILLAARPVDHPGPDAAHAVGPVATPGTIVRADTELVVATGDGFLTVQRVKPEGGKPMDAAAYLRGHAVRAGDRFREHP